MSQAAALPIQPVSLKGQGVWLVPLSLDHHDALVSAVRDGELWRLWYTSIPDPAGMAAEIERRLALQAAGSMLPFTVLEQPGLEQPGLEQPGPEQPGGRVVGMTTYMNIDAVHRRVEVGSTWYARGVQRSALNTEAKLLLFAHAFDDLGCIAVELRTHFLNQQSRRAIERLGARLDGVLRNHQRASDGSLRDTCCYSVTMAEWPAVRSHLRWNLDQARR